VTEGAHYTTWTCQANSAKLDVNAGGGFWELYTLQRTSRLLQCGLLVFLFLFARSFHLSWRNRAFGIALGFGITATISLVNASIRSQIETPSPTDAKNILTLISQVGDVAAVGVWMAYSRARETMAQVPSGPFPSHDLQTWSQELRRLLP